MATVGSEKQKVWKLNMILILILTRIEMEIQNTRCPSIFWKTSLNETLHDAYGNTMSR